MPLAIDWKLDSTEPPLIDSLLGRISLSDGADVILEDSVYLDSWLEALARAAGEVSPAERKAATFEIVEESTPLRVQMGGEVPVIAFRGHQVRADSRDDFRRAVIQAGSSFLNEVGALQGASENRSLERLKTLLEGVLRVEQGYME